LQEELPNLDASLKFASRADLRLKGINLTVDEWRIIKYVNPKNTIRQIAKANNLSEFQIRRIIYGMMQAGIVELIEPPKVEQPPAYVRPRGQRTESVTEKRSVVNRLIDKIKSL
jgi:hypothetical protein